MTRQTPSERLRRLSRFAHAMQLDALKSMEAAEQVQAIFTQSARCEAFGEMRILIEKEITEHLDDLETKEGFADAVERALKC